MPTRYIHNPRNLPLSDISTDDIQLGHLLHLPFRYRVPGLFRFPQDKDGIELFLRNSLSVAPGESSLDLYCRRRTSLEEVNRALGTDALIVFRNANPLPSPEALARIRTGDPALINFAPTALRLQRILSDFTTAYLLATGESIGVHCPRLLHAQESLDSGRVYVTIVLPSESKLSDEEATTILDRCTPEGSHASTHGELHDLSPADLAKIPQAFAAHQEHVFYEFVVRSRAAREQEEFQIALLLACVALEAVHAALFHVLLPGNANDRGRENLINNRLREQGFYRLFQVTSESLLKPAERPEPQLVEDCKKAVEARNAIMHAKNNKGQYTMRQHSTQDLTRHQTAVLKMVEVFETALRRRVPLVV